MLYDEAGGDSRVERSQYLKYKLKLTKPHRLAKSHLERAINKMTQIKTSGVRMITSTIKYFSSLRNFYSAKLLRSSFI